MRQREVHENEQNVVAKRITLHILFGYKTRFIEHLEATHLITFSWSNIFFRKFMTISVGSALTSSLFNWLHGFSLRIVANEI